MFPWTNWPVAQGAGDASQVLQEVERRHASGEVAKEGRTGQDRTGQGKGYIHDDRLACLSD